MHASDSAFSSDTERRRSGLQAAASGRWGVNGQGWMDRGFAVATLCLLAFVVLALASWNVADPSLSHATDSAVTNWMGFPGAVVSDLVMQFFGLGSLFMIVPVAIRSIMTLRGRDRAPMPAAAGFLFGGVLLGSATISLFPIFGQWPLPTGLGGVVGDLLLRIPGIVTGGYPAGLFALLVGVLLAPAAGWCLWRGVIDTRESARSAAAAGSDSGSRSQSAPWETLHPAISVGAILHAWYSASTTVRRVLGLSNRARRSDQRSGGLRDQNGDLAGAGGAYDPAEINYEIRLGDDDLWTGNDDAQGYPDHSAPNDDLRRHDDEWDQPSPATSVSVPGTARMATGQDQHQPAPAVSRVAPPAPAPKPGVRVQREAQTSLLSDGAFELPNLHFLSEAPASSGRTGLSDDALEQNARLLEGVLEDFGVKGEIIQVQPGPVVTLYELEPAPGIKSSRVIGLAEDIARSMSAIAARVAVIPGRNAIGIELPNHTRETVYLHELLSSQTYEKSRAKLSLALGKTINGDSVIADLAKMPHLLVAGTTGSGKSVAINTMILSLLYKMTPQECRLIMIDPKMLELSVYDGIPHLLTPVVTDPKKAVVALKWTVREMENRYKNMAKLGVRNIDGYNTRVREAEAKGEVLERTVQTGFDRETGEAVYESERLDLEAMPYIVVIIDEMADLMMVAGKEIEGTVQRLAQMARAAGIHVIMATQRPSVDVITGTIKANFPTRISFQVTSKIDSRTILGEQGAEQLLGMGDMLYMAGGGRIQRVHGPFVADEEVEDVVKHLKTQGVPQYLEAVTEDDEDGEAGEGPAGSAGVEGMAGSDDPYDQAVAIVLRDRKASTSYIQRRLGIGYNRAASLIERMEQEGVISPANHAGKRDILVPSEEEQQAGL